MSPRGVAGRGRPAFTVIIPTHDHPGMLGRAVASVQSQTRDDLDLVIIGDGAGDDTRDVVADLSRSDRRIRFLDRPKSPRTGEPHRHELLSTADTEAVAYLSDDDLWLPQHLEVIAELLSAHDFAHTLPSQTASDGTTLLWRVDLSTATDRRRILQSDNRIPLATAAHTLAMYRRLPHGWRTAPRGTPTDHWMWIQILELHWVRATSSPEWTCLHFPAHSRSPDEVDPGDTQYRVLERFLVRDGGPTMAERAVRAALASWARTEDTLDERTERLEAVEQDRAVLRAELEAERDGAGRLRRELAEAAAALVDERRLRRQIEQTATWRLHDAFVRARHRVRPRRR